MAMNNIYMNLSSLRCDASYPEDNEGSFQDREMEKDIEEGSGDVRDSLNAVLKVAPDEQIERLIKDSQIEQKRQGRYQALAKMSHEHALALDGPTKAKLEELKNYRIAMVDDFDLALCRVAPYFIPYAQDVRAFRFYGDQDVEHLYKLLVEADSNLVLMDYDLTRGNSGAHFIRVLRSRLPEVQFIGFSSQALDAVFESAGAVGSVSKNVNDGLESLLEVAKLLKKFK